MHQNKIVSILSPNPAYNDNLFPGQENTYSS